MFLVKSKILSKKWLNLIYDDDFMFKKYPNYKWFFCSHFLPTKFIVRRGKQMHWTTWVFIMFSCIFCCELQFYQWTLVLNTEILSCFGERRLCWTLKSWVFLVNEKRSLSEPEKLKISVWSTVEWTKTTQDFSVKHQGELIKLKVSNQKCMKTWWKLRLWNAFVFQDKQ